MSRRIPPLKLAELHVRLGRDPSKVIMDPCILKKGRGVRAVEHIAKGDFILHYKGELISAGEGFVREETKESVFRYYFDYSGQGYCVDATEEHPDAGLGRLVNHSRAPNSKMKVLCVDKKPCLCLFALKDIPPKQEITYDYGLADYSFEIVERPVEKRGESGDAKTSVSPGGIGFPCCTGDVDVIMEEDSESDATVLDAPGTGSLSYSGGATCKSFAEEAAVPHMDEDSGATVLDAPGTGSLSYSGGATCKSFAEEAAVPHMDEDSGATDLDAPGTGSLSYSGGARSFAEEADVQDVSMNEDADATGSDNTGVGSGRAKSEAAKNASSAKSRGSKAGFSSSKQNDTVDIYCSFDEGSDDSLHDPDYVLQPHSTSSENDESDVVEVQAKVNPSAKSSKHSDAPKIFSDEDDESDVVEVKGRKPSAKRSKACFNDSDNHGKDYVSDSGDSVIVPVQAVPDISKFFEKDVKSVCIEEFKKDVDCEECDDVCSESELDEEAVMRDCNMPGVYIRKLLKNSTSTVGKKKKSERVYNVYQYCAYCSAMVSNFAQHLQRAHKNKKKVEALMTEENPKEKKRLLAVVRNGFNHMLNMKSIGNEHGEIILNRRPDSKLDVSEYGPCPCCFLWMRKQLLYRHQKSCPTQPKPQIAASVITQSDTLSRRISPEADKRVRKEVFGIMKRDDVGLVARADSLLNMLGNMWMEKNLGNRLKRGKYTSAIMRLNARLLINLRKICPLKDDPDCSSKMWDYLTPKHFSKVVEATLLTAAPDMDDEDDLEKPSNALKLGYDLRRMASIKCGQAIMTKDKDARSEAEEFLSLMNVFWATKVNRLARMLLEERHFNKRTQLPQPQDIKALNDHLSAEIKGLDLSDTTSTNFAKVAKVISAKILMYNRRRTGEVEAIRLADYSLRKKGVDDSSSGYRHILGELTKFERQLLESQEIFETRGKRGRGVPVIIPQECTKAMAFLANPAVRQSAGVKDSVYLFARKGGGVVTAYDALASVAAAANLESPEKITSTQLRKYMATVTQVLALNPSQIEWVMNHMGHTLDVHKIHYCNTSDAIERVEIAKMLLLQDNAAVGDFANKTLEDIQLGDIVFTGGEERGQRTEIDDDVTSECFTHMAQAPSTLHDPIHAKVLDLSEDLFNMDEQDVVKEKKGMRKSRKNACQARVVWTEEEEQEIRKLFKRCFLKKERPKPSMCQKAIDVSKKAGGVVWKRSKSTLKKKVFRMIDKL